MSDHQLRESLKHDALGQQRCVTCAAWHNPDGMPVGMCVLGPGTAFLVGIAPPTAAMLRNPGVPLPPQPQPASSALPKGPNEGCLQWRPRANTVN